MDIDTQTRGPIRRRNLGEDTLARRHAEKIVQPFAKEFDGWQSRAAFLEACLSVDRGQRRLRLLVEVADMLSKVHYAHRSFTAAIAAEQPRSRYRDLLSCYESLEQRLAYLQRLHSLEADSAVPSEMKLQYKLKTLPVRDETKDFTFECGFCGHSSTIIVAGSTRSLSDEPVTCPLCGGEEGRLGDNPSPGPEIAGD